MMGFEDMIKPGDFINVSANIENKRHEENLKNMRGLNCLLLELKALMKGPNPSCFCSFLAKDKIINVVMREKDIEKCFMKIN